jgi:DNA modification methylase
MQLPTAGGKMSYEKFIEQKSIVCAPAGIEVDAPNPALFDFQRDIVRWALKRGRAAIFADCGMGKTPMQLEWARHIPGDVLILAPLAVAQQTVREGRKFGVEVNYCRDQSQVKAGITITNYEMLEHFDPALFTGIVLDESSILKSYDGATRTAIIEAFSMTPFRLACTATPAPNDYMELGNHAEFLGAMNRTEMLAMFFVHDGGETQQWRLKGHAERDFWKWVCSWAVMIRKPSDLGYEDRDFILPDLIHHEIRIEAQRPTEGFLFPVEALTLQERIGARRETVQERVEECAALVNGSKEPWLIWCHLNSESQLLGKLIPDAVEVSGSDSMTVKESRLNGFTEGKHRVLITKPSIAGFGMNWQHCNHVAFVGLSDSWEQYYQAVRRCWRFGQKKAVQVYLISSELEGAVVANIKRKEADAAKMAEEMVNNMHELNEANLHGMEKTVTEYKTDDAEGEGWTLKLGDCVERVKELADGSIDFTVFSPPFASLYTYSNSPRDMGNCKNDGEFFEHFKFLIAEMLRVTKPGRLLSFHCMNLPTSKTHFGYIGIRDFRGELIKAFEDAGWIYHSEVCIWKDPVTAMQRTKALGLLHKQLKKDSCMSRQGIADYLVTMRKPGDNPDPVTHTNESFPVQVWQKYASPVWMDINPSDTLQFRSAREHNDERHICPLQLQVIERAMELWTNPGDTVLSPFAGIGSEGHVALTMGRKFVGVELKESYWKQARANLQQARRQDQLFE